ncbi:hypothetical protein AVEN_266825-1 [Araneus ventricosus]|uniref:Uncharacterized protein n=1 Tax=Araneus ventricosus TaxID=182803 RepID=A0A4Y2J9I7_ARAVE|nr:hypothetical protein AVEN_266825-1 [Araneus ventricosus]
MVQGLTFLRKGERLDLGAYEQCFKGNRSALETTTATGRTQNWVKPRNFFININQELLRHRVVYNQIIPFFWTNPYHEFSKKVLKFFPSIGIHQALLDLEFFGLSAGFKTRSFRKEWGYEIVVDGLCWELRLVSCAAE